MLQVKKRSGIVEEWNRHKVERSIQEASKRVGNKISEEGVKHLVRRVEEDFIGKREVSTLDVTVNLMNKLRELGYLELMEEYRAFNKYRDRFAESFKGVREFSNSIMYQGDKENANKDTALNSTKQAVISESIMKEMVRTFEYDPKWIKAHDEGWIHIHDLGSRFLNGINCCLFDMGNLLKGGFKINGMEYREPKSIQTALNVMGDVTLSASGNQYGGFTIPRIDSILTFYAEKTYNRWKDFYIEELGEVVEEDLIEHLAKKRTEREIEKGYIGFETKINTISNSLGQTPFVTITFGLDTTYWGREITKTILKVRREGIDKDGTTSIFPKLVFLAREDVNRREGAPNYDIYLDAIETSRTRMYPDYLSLDGASIGNNLAEIYEKSGEVVSPMGCRAYLGEYLHPETGEMVIEGRNNIGAVSLNIVKMAIESKGDFEEFYKLIDKYSKYVWEIHDLAFSKIAKSKGSSNPLLYCEGGSWMSVGYDDSIYPIIKASTASIGYVGLNEASEYFFKEPISTCLNFGLEVVNHLKKLVEDEQGKHEYIPALYATPAESLVYRFQKLNREQYGVIKNVTDREYMTNSFHVHVKEDISPLDKIFIEAPYHQISTGGRISYTEFPNGVSLEVLKDCIDFAMDKGMYYGVNIVSSTCVDCKYQGDFNEECPKCGSKNVTTVTRACGYLSFSKINGDTRYNKGKQEEIKDRVKHVKGVDGNG